MPTKEWIKFNTPRNCNRTRPLSTRKLSKRQKPLENLCSAKCNLIISTHGRGLSLFWKNMSWFSLSLYRLVSPLSSNYTCKGWIEKLDKWSWSLCTTWSKSKSRSYLCSIRVKYAYVMLMSHETAKAIVVKDPKEQKLLAYLD